jgi:hypothetical protein
MKRLLVAIAIAGVFQMTPSVLAQQQERSIFANHLRGQGSILTLLICEGYGLNISFIPTGELVKRAWLDDPSKVTLDFDAPLESTGAKIIHLKRIEPLDFPNLPEGPATLLSVVTETPSGDRNLYHFRIAYGFGVPEYYTLTIYPDTRPLPLIDIGLVGIQATLDDVEKGLRIAESKRLVKSSDTIWVRVQNFIYLVRGGESILNAAERAEISMSLVIKLARDGLDLRLREQYRPNDSQNTVSKINSQQ